MRSSGPLNLTDDQIFSAIRILIREEKSNLHDVSIDLFRRKLESFLGIMEGSLEHDRARIQLFTDKALLQIKQEEDDDEEDDVSRHYQPNQNNFNPNQFHKTNNNSVNQRPYGYFPQDQFSHHPNPYPTPSTQQPSFNPLQQLLSPAHLNPNFDYYQNQPPAPSNNSHFNFSDFISTFSNVGRPSELHPPPPPSRFLPTHNELPYPPEVLPPNLSSFPNEPNFHPSMISHRPNQNFNFPSSLPNHHLDHNKQNFPPMFEGRQPLNQGQPSHPPNFISSFPSISSHHPNANNDFADQPPPPPNQNWQAQLNFLQQFQRQRDDRDEREPSYEQSHYHHDEQDYGLNDNLKLLNETNPLQRFESNPKQSNELDRPDYFHSHESDYDVDQNDEYQDYHSRIDSNTPIGNTSTHQDDDEVNEDNDDYRNSFNVESSSYESSENLDSDIKKVDNENDATIGISNNDSRQQPTTLYKNENKDYWSESDDDTSDRRHVVKMELPQVTLNDEERYKGKNYSRVPLDYNVLHSIEEVDNLESKETFHSNDGYELPPSKIHEKKKLLFKDNTIKPSLIGVTHSDGTNNKGSVSTPLDKTKGYELLKKMGWRGNTGLGKNENGIKENLADTLKLSVKNDREGLNEYKNVDYSFHPDQHSISSSSDLARFAVHNGHGHDLSGGSLKKSTDIDEWFDDKKEKEEKLKLASTSTSSLLRTSLSSSVTSSSLPVPIRKSSDSDLVSTWEELSASPPHSLKSSPLVSRRPSSEKSLSNSPSRKASSENIFTPGSPRDQLRHAASIIASLSPNSQSTSSLTNNNNNNVNHDNIINPSVSTPSMEYMTAELRGYEDMMAGWFDDLFKRASNETIDEENRRTEVNNSLVKLRLAMKILGLIE